MKIKVIEQLCEEGVLQRKQLDRIRLEAEKEPPATRRWLATCLALLAAALVAAGGWMLMEGYWHLLSPTVRCTGGILLMAAAWVGWYMQQKKRPLVAQGLALLGGILWMGNIMLISTLYQLNGTAPDFLAVSLLGLVFIPFLTRQVLLIGLVAGLSVLLWMSMVDSQEDTPLAMHDFAQEHRIICYYISIVLWLIWWLAGENWRNSRGLYRGYRWVGVVALAYYLPNALIYLIIVPSNVSSPYLGAISLAVPALCALFKPRGTAWGPWILFGITTGIFATSWTLDQLPLEENVRHGFILLIAAVEAAVLMGTGVALRRSSWVIIGACFAAFLVPVMVIHKIFPTQEITGEILIGLAVLLVSVAFLISRTKRKEIQTKEPSDTSSAI